MAAKGIVVEIPTDEGHTVVPIELLLSEREWEMARYIASAMTQRSDEQIPVESAFPISLYIAVKGIEEQKFGKNFFEPPTKVQRENGLELVFNGEQLRTIFHLMRFLDSTITDTLRQCLIAGWRLHKIAADFADPGVAPEGEQTIVPDWCPIDTLLSSEEWSVLEYLQTLHQTEEAADVLVASLMVCSKALAGQELNRAKLRQYSELEVERRRGVTVPIVNEEMAGGFMAMLKELKMPPSWILRVALMASAQFLIETGNQA